MSGLFDAYPLIAGLFDAYPKASSTKMIAGLFDAYSLLEIGTYMPSSVGHLLSSYATWVVSLFSMLLCSLLLMLLIFASHLG